jgi:glutamyl-tRNA synthetase
MMCQGTPYCYRFRVPPNKEIVIPDKIRGEVRFNTNNLGDFVVLRSNGLPVYNFCVAIDDALMRISHVIRAVSFLSVFVQDLLIQMHCHVHFPIVLLRNGVRHPSVSQQCLIS